MRIPIAVAALCVVLNAQRPEDAVLSVYRQMEKAEQSGNGDAWVALWSPKSEAIVNPEKVNEFKSMIRPRPSVHYTATKILVEGERAALVGTMDDQYLSMRFALENGTWKIHDQTWSNVPIDPASLYVLVPPPDGSFARAGSPWETLPRATVNAKYFKPEQMSWSLHAVSDESYVYVRIEAASALPPPNTQVFGTFPNLKSGVPRDWPVMKIRVTGTPAREYSLDVADFIGDQATFDESGKANSHRFFIVYSAYVRKGDQTVFSFGAGARVDPLISVHDRDIDVKLPLKALGAMPAARIEITDANWPVTKFVTYEVKPFGR
jgi:hypothetical protein